MRVQALYFGILKDLLGRSTESLDVQQGATVAEVLSLCALQASNLRDADKAVWDTLATAVNRSYAGPATVLEDGDEIAFLPPVSGGAEAA